MPELTAGRKQERLKGLGRTMILVTLLWTVAVAASLLWTTSQRRSQAIQLATDKARTILAKDITLRRWATSHGGVYVPVSDRTPPNPLLSHLPERDITTPSGRRLTLMNPAYILRQIVADFSSPQSSAHLASLKPMRPENTPDPWEVEALRSFEKGTREVVGLHEGAAGTVVRVMQPLQVDQANCLSCHGSSGYRLGDVRGGLSATVSLAPYLELVTRDQHVYQISHGLIWLLGMAGIGAAGLRSRRHLIRQFESQEKLAESSRFLVGVIEAIQDLVVVIDRDYRVVLSNWHGVPAGRRRTGGRPPFCYDCLEGLTAPCDDCHLPHAFEGRTVVREAISSLDGRHKEITVYPYRDANNDITLAIEIMRDCGERKEMEQALRDSEARFRRFAEQAQDVLYRLRLFPSPAFEYVSPAIRSLSSHSPHEWVADANLCLRLVHPEDLPILRSILEGAVPASGTFTLRFVRSNGETVWTEHRTTTVIGADGRPAALEGIARDISRQVEAAQKMQSFNLELERRVAERSTRLDQATREMEEFCYSISHDFKGPLRAINGYTHLLEESCCQHSGLSECSLSMQKIKQASAHMGELMDHLLELGRISRTPFAQETVDVTALCRRITRKLQERDPGRNAIFTVAEEMSATADPAMLERLLQILLENAWNFTAAKAAAVIEVNRVVTDRRVVFNVRDNGVGFNMAYTANLFKPFQRLHRPEEHGGIGMGLALARRIVERHGGRIWGEGEPGEGATFYFTLS